MCPSGNELERADSGEDGVVGDGDVVTVVLDGAEFVQGVERFFELSCGWGI